MTWTLDEDGLLTVSGTGAMASYDTEQPPYYRYKNEILTVKIEEGVTAVGYEAFDDFPELTEVTLSEGLEHLGNFAFYHCSALREHERLTR